MAEIESKPVTYELEHSATLERDSPGVSALSARSIAACSDLVLAFARVLHVNGQSTHETVAACKRLSNNLGLRATIIPGWGELQLQATDGNARLVSLAAASPTGVHMERVALAMRSIDEIPAKLTPSAAMEAVRAITDAAPAPTWLFTLAAAAGAAAMAVIFGAHHLPAVALIVTSAAAGAVLRRTLARFSTNIFLQPFCAALLAGIIGAVAVRFQLSSSLRLVAVCPCMILIPGPHLLNGTMDLIAARISLGASRLLYAGLIVLAISAGLLLGLGSLGVLLPVGEPARAVPLAFDVIAAGVAVAAFSIFFSTPLRMLAWPVVVGMLAHALRWWAIGAGADTATGALVGSMVVGLILTPVARRWEMPFAAVGFASVVSMMPGVFMFRMASGLVQLAQNSNASFELLHATISEGFTAFSIVLAMTFGVVVPKSLIDHLENAKRKLE